MVYTLTRGKTIDGLVMWGYRLSNGYRCLPCWHTKRAAVAAAEFHARLFGLA